LPVSIYTRFTSSVSHRFNSWALHRAFVAMVATLVWIEHRHVLKHQFSSIIQLLKRCDTLLVNLV
ncbi:MAG: hypothetical protein AAGM27_10770, partial [Cyanobacteria bacterium J06554_3]